MCRLNSCGAVVYPFTDLITTVVGSEILLYEGCVQVLFKGEDLRESEGSDGGRREEKEEDTLATIVFLGRGNACGCSTYRSRPVMELYPLEAHRGKK